LNHISLYKIARSFQIWRLDHDPPAQDVTTIHRRSNAILKCGRCAHFIALLSPSNFRVKLKDQLSRDEFKNKALHNISLFKYKATWKNKERFK